MKTIMCTNKVFFTSIKSVVEIILLVMINISTTEKLLISVGSIIWIFTPYSCSLFVISYARFFWLSIITLQGTHYGHFNCQLSVKIPWWKAAKVDIYKIDPIWPQVTINNVYGKYIRISSGNNAYKIIHVDKDKLCRKTLSSCSLSPIYVNKCPYENIYVKIMLNTTELCWPASYNLWNKPWAFICL